MQSHYNNKLNVVALTGLANSVLMMMMMMIVIIIAITMISGDRNNEVRCGV